MNRRNFFKSTLGLAVVPVLPVPRPPKAETNYVCSECGSQDLQYEVWIHANSEQIMGDCEGDVWCEVCKDHSKGCCLINEETGKCLYHSKGDQYGRGCWLESEGS